MIFRAFFLSRRLEYKLTPVVTLREIKRNEQVQMISLRKNNFTRSDPLTKIRRGPQLVSTSKIDDSEEMVF